MNRYLTVVVALMACCVAVLLPGVTGYIGYESQRAILHTEAEINARVVSALINDNPELWQFETVRLEELLRRRPGDRTREIRSVIDLHGRTVSETHDGLSGMLISEEAPVYDAGVPVGLLRISRSLYPLVIQVLWASLLGVLLGEGHSSR